MYQSGSTSPIAMRRLLAADAAWDLVLGAMLCVFPFVADRAFGIRLDSWWPAFALVGLASIAFGVLLVRAARGVKSQEVCTAAAIANGLSAAALMLVVSLVPFQDNAIAITLLLIALICSAFGFLEWRQLT